MAVSFYEKKRITTRKRLEDLKEKTVEASVCSVALYGSENLDT